MLTWIEAFSKPRVDDADSIVGIIAVCFKHNIAGVKSTWQTASLMCMLKSICMETLILSSQPEKELQTSMVTDLQQLHCYLQHVSFLCTSSKVEAELGFYDLPKVKPIHQPVDRWSRLEQ